MKSRLILALTLLAAPAAAQTPERVDPPPFKPPLWNVDATHAQVMMRDLMAPFPENVHATAQVWSLRPPNGGGQLIGSVLLIGVQAEGKAFVRSRLDELRRTPEIVAGGDPDAAGKVRTVSWSEKVDDAQKLVEGKLEWAHDGHGTVSMVRTLWIRPTEPPNTIEEFRVECVLAADQVAALRPACEQALASLEPRTLTERQAIAVAPVQPEPAPGDEADGDDATGAPASMRETPSQVGPVLVSRPAREPERDMRPFYVGAFILIVIAVLWWNRKKRAELEDEEKSDADAEAIAEAGGDQRADEKSDDEKEQP